MAYNAILRWMYKNAATQFTYNSVKYPLREDSDAFLKVKPTIWMPVFYKTGDSIRLQSC